MAFLSEVAALISLYKNRMSWIFYAECTENDSYPDVGKASRYTVIDASDLEGDFSVTFPVTVTEGHGRYAGNTARFSVTFYFELQ